MIYLLSNNLFGVYFLYLKEYHTCGKNFGKTIVQKKAKQGKTFGVCRLLKADSKCEIEKNKTISVISAVA